MSSETSKATTQHSERSYSAFLSGLAKEILQLSICHGQEMQVEGKGL